MRRLILAFALVIAACGSSAGDSGESTSLSTTTTTTSTTTTTTSSSTTTTTLPATQQEITRFTKFEPGVPYRGSVPIDYQVRFERGGWKVQVVGAELERFIVFENDEPAPGAQAMIVLFSSDPLEHVRNHPLRGELTERPDEMLGGHVARSLDLYVPPREGESAVFPPCAAQVHFGDDRDFQGTGWTADLTGCAWNRVWAVTVDDVVVTVAVGPFEREEDTENPISEFQELLDDFVNAITFCTEATPCDE